MNRRTNLEWLSTVYFYSLLLYIVARAWRMGQEFARAKILSYQSHRVLLSMCIRLYVHYWPQFLCLDSYLLSEWFRKSFEILRFVAFLSYTVGTRKIKFHPIFCVSPMFLICTRKVVNRVIPTSNIVCFLHWCIVLCIYELVSSFQSYLLLICK